MASRSHALSFLAGALLLSQSVLAVPFPDEFVGPPSYSLMGCPYNAEWSREVVAQATGLSEHFRRLESKWGITPRKLCVTDPTMISGMVERLTAPKKRFDEPDVTWEQRAMTLRDEDGNIPADGLQNALAQRQTLIDPGGGGGGPTGGGAGPTGSGGTGYLTLANGISTWTEIGPGNIGGRVRAISPSPATPGTILVGSVSGGVFRSTDSGASWTVALDPFMQNVAIRCLVRDPAVASGLTVYACTGEGVISADAVRGLGIFKSTNGGTDWAQLPSTNPATAGTDWFYVNRLAISPTDSLVMLAATNGGVYRTADGGTTWTKVYEGVGTNRWRSVQDITFHPTNGNIALLGESQHVNCLSTCALDGNGVAYSSDGGATWTRTKLNTGAITGASGRVEVAIAKSNPNIAYAVVDVSQGQLYKSTDGGLTWTPNAPISTPAHLGAQGWYDNAIWVAPNDENRVIVGGVSQKMSTNGGSTFTTIASGVHPDNHVYASDPNYLSNFTLYNGNDGGVYKATGLNTATPTYTSLNNDLRITQFYGGSGNATTGRIVGGTQDNGTLLYTGSTNNWVRIWGADGGNSAADQSDGNYVYGMDQYGGVMRNNLALAASPSISNSAYICQQITDAACPTNASPQILFTPPMVIDKVTNTTLFLGAKNLWRSQNIKAATVTWSIAKTPNTNNSFISTIALAPGSSDLLWIGYKDGTVACTANASAATPTWVVPTAGAFGRYVTRIAIDPSNNNRVVVATGGYSTPNLRQTTMGCVSTATFTNIHNQLPVAPIRGIEFHPNNSSYMYVGTEVGMFSTSNGGTNWTTTNDGPGTVSVEHLFWLDGSPPTLVAVTHGRGMFKTPVTLPGGNLVTSAPPPNGIVGNAFTFTFTSNLTPTVTWALTSGVWPPGLALNTSSGVLSGTPNTAGTYPVTIGASNTNGNNASQSFTMTIDAGVPGPPTAASATPGNGSASVPFFAGPNGASPIIDFTVTCTASGQITRTATGPASPLLVSALTNGVQYSCAANARNSQGNGPPSNSVTVTPANSGAQCNAASPPGGSVGSAYSFSVSATGSPTPTYALTSGALPGGLSLNTTSGAITGTPNAGGTFNSVVTATNAGGSCTINVAIIIGATVPGAPTIGTGTPGPNSATVSFTAPASNGGSAITSFTATCAGQSQQGASSPITVTGLAGGVQVSCSVKANNAVGSSAASSSVNVTPTSGPAFTSGAAPGGTFNTAYSHTFAASGSPAPTFSLTSGAFPGGLTLNASAGTLSGTPNASGTFTGVVTATNSAGTATQNFSISIAATAPGAPTIGIATPGNGQASISFTPPASNGGSAITGFTATCNPGAITGTAGASPVTVTGLAAGTSYTCSVTATNGVGTSAASGTVSVVPVSAPAFTSAAPPNGTFGTAYAHVYVATGSPGPTFSLTSGAFPPGVTLSGPNLAGTPTAAGTFTGVVTATNSGGTTTQNFSIIIAPAVPGAPTIGAATPGAGQATIAFTAPASNGGAAITGFTATCNPGALSAGGGASPITVTGLNSGTTYSCSVTATNSAGNSAPSGTVSVTPGAAPSFTSAAPAGGTYNVAYSHTYSANGAPAPTFAVTSGALPPGLTLGSGGALTGTPTTGGTFTGVVTATNSIGSATQSFSITITTTLPGAPTIGAGTPGPSFAMVGFTPPAVTGGTPITSYTATCTPGPFSGSAAASPVTVNGLTNGTTYTCSVTATNAVGTGPASGTVTVTPAAVPAFSSAAPAAGVVNVPYSHTYAANGSPAPTFSLTSGAFPTGLSLVGATVSGTPTVQGTFTGVVTATNSAGTATQNFSITIGPAVPGAPTIGTATPGNSQATIAFTPPGSNGGSPITSYTATCNPGGLTGSAAGSPVTVTGLTNGTTYSCSVKANNIAGASAASGSVSVTPGAAPAFTSAAPPGGTFNVGYSYTIQASGSPAPTFSVTSGALPPGLSLASNGALTGTPTTAGTFTGVVTATNASGTATQNFSIAIAAVAPGAPVIGTAIGGVGQATISFTPPALNGGSAITSFTVACVPQPNGPTRSASGAGSPITVSSPSLTNGTLYLCSVTATNSAGTSPPSANVGVTPGNGPSVSSGAPPGGTFGVAYTHTYTATGSPAPTFALTSGAFPTGITLNGTSGLLNGTPTAAGTFTGVVTATNSGGSATQAFSITIAATVPGAPTIGTATAGSGQLTLTFTAPASNGGSAITGYTATCNPGGITASGAASPITVTGLTNGTAYTCSVTANNAVGASTASATVGGTPSSSPAFTSAAPANGVLGVAYTHTFAASGTPAPTFSLTSGAFPTGLTINGTTGALTGTPTANGTFTGVVTATNSAGTATQGFSIVVASVPGAPTIGSATPGNTLATISFTAPASNGGSPITTYTATCNPGTISGSGPASPITVSGLANGTTYTCSVRAVNAIGAGPASGTVNVTPASGIVLALISASSRKVHGNFGAFDLALNTQPIGGSIIVEPRMGTGGHKIVFTFNDQLFSAGAATCVDSLGAPVGTVTRVVVGNSVEVTLTNVPDRKRVTVSVSGVNGTMNVSASVGFLVGDVNNTFMVDSADILRIKGKTSAGAVTQDTFIYDIDLSGGVSLSDTNAAKANSGQTLP